MPKRLKTKLNIPEAFLYEYMSHIRAIVLYKQYCRITCTVIWLNIVHFAPLLNMRRCIVCICCLSLKNSMQKLRTKSKQNGHHLSCVPKETMCKEIIHNVRAEWLPNSLTILKNMYIGFNLCFLCVFEIYHCVTGGPKIRQPLHQKCQNLLT